MAYERLVITDFETLLTAAQISHIEDGIIQNESDIASNVAVDNFYTDNVTVEASGSLSVTVSGISKSGYTALAIVNVAIGTASSGGANPSRVFCYGTALSGTTATVNVRNTYTSDAVVRVTVSVLFKKS